jgi:hypothetical protein
VKRKLKVRRNAAWNDGGNRVLGNDGRKATQFRITTTNHQGTSTLHKIQIEKHEFSAHRTVDYQRGVGKLLKFTTTPGDSLS